MARPGDELINPVTGLRTVFRETAATTSGEVLQVDWIAGPGWTTTPIHVHPGQIQRLEVHSGRLGLRTGKAERSLGPADAAEIPAGTPHAAWNAGEGEVHVLVEFRPALRTEALLETLAALARQGKTTRRGLPWNPLRLAVLLSDFSYELRLARPPAALQSLWLRPLAAAGRVLGYGAS
jgi:quercetin dioxygenase-like cupin family protein